MVPAGNNSEEEKKAPVSVLYVDDEPALLELAQLFLHRSGDIQVTTVSNAEEAIELLKTCSFDVIVSDFQMPGMDGIDLLKYIHPRCNSIPFILFTGRGREEIVIEAINNGATFYLQKGGDPKSQFAELAHKIKQAVRPVRVERELRESRNRFAGYFNLPLIGIVMFSKTGRWIEVNDRACSIFGYTREELSELSFADLSLFEDLDRDLAEFNRLVTGEISSLNMRKRFLRKEGTIIHTEVSAMAICDEDGKPQYLVGLIQDITERIRMEDEIEASSRRYYELADFLPLTVFEINKEGVFTFANRHALAQFQYTEQDIADGLHFTRMVDPAERERAARIGNSMLSGESRKGGTEYRFIRKDGSIFPGLIYSSAVCRNGITMGLRGVIVDVAELRQQEEKFSKIFYNNPALMAISSLKTSLYHDVNLSFEEHTGYSRDEIIGKSSADVHLFVHQSARETMASIIRSGHPLRDFEAEIMTKSGSVRTLLFSGDVLASGDDIYLFSQAIDITERKQMESALRESESQLRTLINAMPDIVCFKDGRGRWLEANEFDLKLFQLEGVDYKGKTDCELADFSPFYRDAFLTCEDSDTATWQTGHAVRGVEEIPRPDGSSLVFDIIKVPTFDDAGARKGLVVIGRDVTGMHQAQSELTLANAKLNLLSSVTRHDILNSLTILIGCLELASESDTREEIMEYLGRCASAAESIRRHIDFTRDYQDLGVSAPVWQDASAIFISCLEGIDSGPVRVTSDLADLYVYADPLLVKVIYNLIDNALRYGGSLTRITSSYHLADHSVVWVVEDDGVGIADEMKEQIFFKGIGHNTGFGLFLAREILAITDISISETGSQGNGARFEIIIPDGKFRIGPDDPF